MGAPVGGVEGELDACATAVLVSIEVMACVPHVCPYVARVCPRCAPPMVRVCHVCVSCVRLRREHSPSHRISGAKGHTRSSSGWPTMCTAGTPTMVSRSSRFVVSVAVLVAVLRAVSEAVVVCEVVGLPVALPVSEAVEDTVGLEVAVVVVEAVQVAVGVWEAVGGSVKDGVALEDRELVDVSVRTLKAERKSPVMAEGGGRAAEGGAMTALGFITRGGLGVQGEQGFETRG